MFAFVILVLWLGMLFSTIGIASSDFFCINLSTMARILGMSESMAGVTFLALGNGSPDVFSTFVAMNTNSGSLAIGELIGAAGFITGVVAGSMALVREFKVGKRAFIRDVGFFVIAAGFSMAFLADGKLSLLECCVMIGFYLFYVGIVITSHWYSRRRRRHRERNALIRGNYITPSSSELDVQEENGDEGDDMSSGERRSLIRDSFEIFGTLEMETSSDDENETESEQARAIAAEMSNSMRLTRKSGSRRNTNPIRPSLVGALEFRSVLLTLQKSSNVSKPIHLRQYSDDTEASSSQLFDPASVGVPWNFTTRLDPTDNHLQRDGSQEMGAGSLNDAPSSALSGPATFSVADAPKISVLSATPSFSQTLADSVTNSRSEPTLLAGGGSASDAMTATLQSPKISLSLPLSERNLSPPLVLSKYNQESAPSESGLPDSRHLRASFQPQLHLDIPATSSPRSRSPGLIIPRSSLTRSPSPISPFPIYNDLLLPLSRKTSKSPSLMLSQQPIPPELPLLQTDPISSSRKRIKWWPYNVLPCPEVIFSTLFPTLCAWKEKPIWDKFISVISAPSIFLLMITLPVVEPESRDNESERGRMQELYPHASRRTSNSLPRSTPGILSANSNADPRLLRHRQTTQTSQIPTPRSPAAREVDVQNNVVEDNISVGNQNRDQSFASRTRKQSQSQVLDNSGKQSGSVGDWNRWLVQVQIFAAPLFIMVIIWANSSDDQLDINYLSHLILYSLLGSLIVLGILLLTTSSDRVPKYRFLLCFIGFVVGVTWISTIANEVVGVLKALGIILNISDAILGLTIFAVGNSLGDLVADMTIARLGYPVMALSACFGGPMLNILLGIGCSGLYILIKKSDRKSKKHPGQPRQFKPYEIQVNRALVISGIALLVILVGLLVAVPLNKWVMSRRIGWGLIMLWSISTAINLVVELTGV